MAEFAAGTTSDAGRADKPFSVQSMMPDPETSSAERSPAGPADPTAASALREPSQPAPPPSRLPTFPIPPGLSVVAATEDFVVVDKPAGLFSVPGKGPDKQDCIAARVAQAFPNATGPISVHRLDMETSGLIVLALNPQTHRALSRQFMQRKVGKTYVAVLDGWVQRDEGAVDMPIIVDWPNRPRQMISYQHGRPARTLFRVIERTTRSSDHRKVTRVAFRPVTGRSHQLRVHAAAPTDIADTSQHHVSPLRIYDLLGPAGAWNTGTDHENNPCGGLASPILGDTLYAHDPTLSPRLLLHADHLAFWSPTTGEWLKYDSPPPF